jgi:hypothetical protein
MSHADSVWTLTNISRRPCFLDGYPDVTGWDAAGHIVFRAHRDTPSPTSDGDAHGAPRRVQLAPGAVASALLTADTASCDHPSTVPTVSISAPGGTSSTRLPYGGLLCPASASVHPVIAGDTGGAL